MVIKDEASGLAATYKYQTQSCVNYTLHSGAESRAGFLASMGVFLIFFIMIEYELSIDPDAF